MSRILPVLRSPKPSRNITKERYRRLLSILPIIILSITLISMIIYIFTHPGYKLTQLDNGDYRVEIQLSTEQAERLATYMEANELSFCTARDICLPDGTFAVARISYDEAKYIAESGTSHHSISIWRYSDNHSASFNESNTVVCIPVQITYSTILEAINRIEIERTRKTPIANVILPNGREAICFLSSEKLEEYRRRMHIVGAKSIIIPFYFILDNAATPGDIPQNPL